MIANYLATGRLGQEAGNHLTLSVAELMAAYLRWAKSYYGNSREVTAIV